MNKLKLFTIDKEAEYEFKKAKIFCLDYTKKIQKNELHTPNAAKIIIEFSNKIQSFILLQPIIKSDKEGNINVFTSSTFNQASLIEKYSNNKIESMKILREMNSLDAQFEMGISIQDVAGKYISQSKKEAIKLEEKPLVEYIGSRF